MLVSSLAPSPSTLQGRNRREWFTLALFGVLVLVAAMWLAGDISRSHTLSDAQEQLNSLAYSQADVIGNIRDKYRALPAVLAQDTQLRQALSDETDVAARQAVNHKLTALARETGASVLYLIDTAGETLAASNWDQPDSFVGQNYAFRPYVSEALREGSSEYFALGTASGRPGLYFARRVGLAGADDAGVIVAKLEFMQLEHEWQRYSATLFVTDADGVVILSSRPDWRFLTNGLLPEARRDEILRARPFGDAELLPLPLNDAPARSVRLRHSATESYLENSVPVPASLWTLHALAPSRAAIATETAKARLTAALAVMTLLTLLALWLQRRRRAREQTWQAASQRRELERLVRARTDALRRANRRLEDEMQALQASRARARVLREQLEQAEKLSFLGQMAAGVAHEINQPLAALRMYSASSRTLARQGDRAGVDDCLDAVDRLTDKIGVITTQLCHYARKPAEDRTDIRVREALDNALLLLTHRLRQQGVTLEIEETVPDLTVRAAQVRLEQVFTNLIRNALDALQGRADARIWLRTGIRDGRAELSLRDNGPGIAPGMRRRLFMPFASGHSDGLGLGLLISHDIIRAFGGTLEECSAPGAGAHFIITLPLSPS